MKSVSIQTRNRVYFLFLLLLGVLFLFMLRLGYMQFIYKQDILTFAYIEQALQSHNEPIINQVKTNFNVYLKHHQEITIEDLILNRKPDVSELSLIELLTNACQGGCTGRPALYVQTDHGYIFYKLENGEDVLLEINHEDGRWAIAKILRNS